MNENQERLLELIKKKKECDKRAQDIVLKLIEPQVDTDYLLKQAPHIGPTHWDDIVEERRLGGICGWTLCSNPLDPDISTKKQRYVIRGTRVLDITARKAFCTSGCYAKSTHFKGQLPVSPLWLRETDKQDGDGPLTFEILGGDTQLHGMVVNVTGLSLTDKDKEMEETESSDSDDKESDKGKDKHWSIATKPWIRLLQPTVARNGLRMLEIRMMQLFLMYFYVVWIIAFKLILPIVSELFSNYFENLRKDALAIFSGTEAYSVMPWTAYVQISNQVFWLSLTGMVVSRTIQNLFLMARTPSFRTLLIRKQQHNHIKAANTLKGTPPGSLVLLLTLLLWTLSTLFRSATKDELVIIRKNNYYGIMRVMTVIVVCNHTSIHTALFENLFIKISLSPSSPDSDIRDYWNAVQLQKFKLNMKKNVIELNLDLLFSITSIVCMSRFIKHRYEVRKLERMLQRIFDAGH